MQLYQVETIQQLILVATGAFLLGSILIVLIELSNRIDDSDILDRHLIKKKHE